MNSLGPISKKRQIIYLVLTLIIIPTALFAQWLYRLNDSIDQQLLKKQFTPSIELLSAPEKFFKDQTLTEQRLWNAFNIRRYRERKPGETVLTKDFAKLNKDQCEQKISNHFTNEIESCAEFRNTAGEWFLIALTSSFKIFDVFGGSPPESVTLTELEPMIFAQYYGSDPILRTIVELGDTPPLCLNALLAIEDSTFLEHGGVNIKSIGRAFLKNITAGRVVQGGSTITQQLVKNYFLSHERTFVRKFKELFMAILLETKKTKDSILEAYINEIYMGQNGPFQIHGFSSAAEFYFGKKLTDLNLPECALTAAIVNGPGVFSPFLSPQKATDRRKLVLEKMVEQNIISQQDMAVALLEPLPTAPQKLLSEPAPFFVDAVMKKVVEMGFDLKQGLKIETTLDLQAQEAAQKSVREGIDSLEKSYKSLQQLKEQGKNLEALLVSANPTNGYIQAIVGGRNFKKSQFNRAIQSRRQVGSVMKPFVYLTAIEAKDANGNPYTPLSLVDDSKFTTEYDKQSWSPDNFENKYFGVVPLYFALAKSLNCATARLGIEIGLKNIVTTAMDFGITSDIKPFPAMTLGAFELSPLEVLESYNAFARLGEHIPLTMIRNIKSINDDLLYEHTIEREQVFDSADVAVLVGMLKNNMINGSGSGATLMGFTHPSGGKTGTTNDKKDAWFAGFTPLHTAVVWVGYDDNTSHGLTGAQGAVPIWTNYMKQTAATYPPLDFRWPENVTVRTVDVETQKSLNVPEKPDRPLSDIQLVFKND